MPTHLPQADRMGALRPRYSFFLNPHRNERFMRCPRCKATMRVRKIPLVIHVDSVGLVFLRKTCRLCVGCEMLIAHEAEVNRVIGGLAAAHREELLEDWNLARQQQPLRRIAPLE